VFQPLNQGTRLGETATFVADAQGTPPLSYQWSKNATVISGASAASYTTPPVSAADNGSTFTVTISNAVGSITSSPALLTVGPRAPQTGDWRFQAMDLPAAATVVVTDITGLGERVGQNYLGTPLQVGLAGGLCGGTVPDNCAWSYTLSNLPNGASPLNSWYGSDSFENLEADVDGLSGSTNNVITSFDLEPANDVFALSWLQTSAGGAFNATHQWVAPQNVQTVVSQLGLQSGVVTAVTFNAGQVLVLSYTWQSDTATVFEAQAVFATVDTFANEAMNLAAEGYIITAFGGDPTDGVLLVGTRVQGDTIPRPIAIWGGSQQGQVDSTVQPLVRDLWTANPSNTLILEQ